MIEDSRLSVLMRVLDANVRYTALATRMVTTALERGFSMSAAAAPASQPFMDPPREPASETPSSAAIVLEGEADSIATGFFVVENSLPYQISTAVEVSPLTAPGGRQIASALRFEPGRMTLGAGERVVARVTAKIGRRLPAGVAYGGEILIPGVPGARIPIVLRRRAGPRKRSDKAPIGERR